MLLLMVFVVGCAPVAFAYGSQDEHDKDLKYALFGSTAKKLLDGDENRKFEAISNAASLAIDQFSSNDQQKQKKSTYDDLQCALVYFGLPDLPDTFDNLDLNIHVSPDNVNITARNHRKYTHLGWDYKGYPNEAFWEKRKQILIHTVNWTLFQDDDALLSKVPFLSDVLYAPSEQCIAFCKIIYYIHILGDHEEGDVSKKLEYLEPIQYVDTSTPGIITELKEQLQILLKNRCRSWSYAGLMEAIITIEIESEEDYKTWGKLDTEEKCEINKEYAIEIMYVLSLYLPHLLKNEPFFSKSFEQALQN